ncbi:MAG: flagellin [Candidatus Lambdaproteobacteria bacterium RIFOXYD1_FULL_56_27]|uniref:Flagellin n=1 Tax=Candidatus Lambdaproteobacteria bacterium RIFOXYD2_FULL_56_26 TaxID=1817773 RepID=A0A1F6H0D8_9PROT|nr:MAG: flagellin [Candidatus Lambdaproteobacteria bacterium RIFOXYC1_FULL_56_13]OGH03868.1 MAG: flagellin [Candidatus Lambdaproteobacteria bacterium RIFOXYD2_FULL_56_26]OGH08996.1 MAG: flagellin [Candidatus Lambdaproteobacteria bacterium RIFOXYD1_FULL_56_27]
MSLRINHNIAAINAHRNLNINDTSMSKTLEKLSSGLKVNRASDGPAALVISEQMRGQIAGMSQAIDNSETAVSLVQTTEANLNEVSRLLVSVRQLAVHAANEGVNDETMLEADQQEITNALATIDRVAAQAQFGNKRLLDGSQGASGSTTGDQLQFVEAGLKTKDSREAGFEVKVTQNASKSFVDGKVALTDETIKAGETFTLIENGKMASYRTTMDDTVDTAVKNLKSEVRRNGLNVDVELNANNTLSVKHKEYGSAYGFQFSSSTAGVLSSEAGQIEVSSAGNDIKGTINGESAIGEGQVLTGQEGTASVDGLKVKFTGQVGDADGVIPEGGSEVGRAFVSQNAMNFQVGGNFGQTVGISVESVNTRSLANNIQNESGFKSLSEVDVRTFQGAQDAMRMVDDAITRISARRGELGAFQKNTLESNLNNLRIAHENLTSSESILRDVDMAAEMASYTKNQIMTQSATAMLAQANQTPATVLQLLK